MDFIQPFGAVVLVLALLGGALVVLRKRGNVNFRMPGPRRMEVLERVALSPQHALHLVRLGERTLVIASAPSSCSLLCEEAPK